MNDNDRGPHDASELTALRDRVAQLEQALVDHRQQLEKLRHSEEYARLLFEHAPDGYYVCDLQGTFIDGNRAAEQIVGYPRQELIGESFLKLRLLSRQEIVKAGRLLLHSARGLATGPELFTLNRKDGTQATVEIRTHPIRIEGRVRILGIARDITHHKELEAALTRAEERYTLAVSAGRVGVWDWDLETNDIYLDPVLKSMLGFEANEIRNHMDDWSQRVHPEDMELVMAEVTAHLEGRKPLFEVEHRMVCKDGGIRWYLARGSAFHDLDGHDESVAPFRTRGRASFTMFARPSTR